jgi:ubiquinone/menaquinone biosynthesis C-methylase UbiE
LADLKPGERVVDLGSGSGTDAFTAALHVGRSGSVLGVDITDAQLEKARTLRNARPEFSQVDFRKAYIEDLPVEDASVDCVVSNGVINLVPNKVRVFAEAARVLKHGGRLAISDIVTRVHLPDSVVCDANLWAACIGGAMHRDEYQKAIEDAGLEIQVVKLNDYRFLPGRADRSATKFGVISVSLLAVKK